MRKVYRVVRYSGTKVKWEDSLSLPQEWADRIAQCCERKSEGYILNDNILTELLGQSLSDSDRFSLLALLACVWQRQRIVFLSKTFLKNNLKKMSNLNEKKDSGFFRVRDAREVIVEEIVLPCLMKGSLNAEPRKNDGYGI